MTPHEVAAGETLESIAKRHGHHWKTIWDHPDNAALKQKRKDPGILLEGDVLQVPDRVPRQESRPTGDRHRFRRDGGPPVKKGSLRIVLYGMDDKPVEGKEWEFVAPVAAKGTTAKDGLIEVRDVPIARAAGELTVKLPPPAAPAPAPAPAPAAPPPAPPPDAPPPYPPPLRPEDFKDKDPEVTPPDAAGLVEWTLRLGVQEDFADDAGAKTRLRNLAFRCDPDSADPVTARAVKAYQRRHMKQEPPSGVLADAKAHLTSLHDNP